MTLGEKRREFSKMISQLVLWCSDNGYGMMYDQVKRTQAEAQSNAASGAGIANSLHTLGLAADLQGTKPDGSMLETVEDFRPIGEQWKSMHPENAWGGDFVSRPDADHFSRSHNGVR